MKEKVQVAAARPSSSSLLLWTSLNGGYLFDVLRKLYENRINRVENFFVFRSGFGEAVDARPRQVYTSITIPRTM